MPSYDAPLFSDPGRMSIYIAGSLTPRAIDALYPMEFMTKYHYANHIKGLTGRWMDSGDISIRSATRGSFHRLTHGHHLLDDGFKVLTHPDLKFGEFLHHLGMDALTKRGIPNPLVPKSMITSLANLGLSKSHVNELVTINVPKLLGASVSFIVSGVDVYMAFSDAIPHTFSSAAGHLAIGAIELAIGVYPAPNAIMISAGMMELGVGAATTYRAATDPILPLVDVPGSVLFPYLEEVVPLTGLFGACAGYWSGGSTSSTLKGGLTGLAASTAGTIAKFSPITAGFLGPFAGPAAAAATALIMRQILKSRPELKNRYRLVADDSTLDLLPMSPVIPLHGIPKDPIGQMEGSTLRLDHRAIAGLLDAQLSTIQFSPSGTK